MGAMNRKTLIAWIVTFSVAIVMSAVVVIVSICFTASMIRVYPKPIDSFWSLELSVALIIVFSILLIGSAVGLVLCSLKLKNTKKADRT